jgi:hypothetical protein
LVGNLTDVHNSGTFPPGQDGDTNVTIVPRADEANQALLRNRRGRPNDGGVIECEVHLYRDDHIDGPRIYEDWVGSLIGVEVTAKGVFVEDEGHDDKTELHPLDILYGQVGQSRLPGDWIGQLAQRRGLQVGVSLFAYRFAAAADDRKHGAFLGTPLAQWTRPTSVTLAVPPRPGGDSQFPAAEVQIGFQLNATTEVSTLVDAAGAGVANLTVTCLGKNYSDGGVPGFVIGEVATYWSPGRQLALSDLDLDFGTRDVGQVSQRTLVVRNVGVEPVQVTIPADSPSTSAFDWNGFGPTSLDVGQEVAVQIDFSPLTVGTHRGHVTVTSDTQASPQQVTLHGRCSGGPPQ